MGQIFILNHAFLAPQDRVSYFRICSKHSNIATKRKEIHPATRGPPPKKHKKQRPLVENTPPV